jgi:carbon-monoxide dehydrogenase medium subunit
MKPAQFRYHAPSTIEEAVSLLARLEHEDGRILAGGQSLVPMMNLRLATPGHLIDINGVAGLDQLRRDGSMLIISACVRHADIERQHAENVLERLLVSVASYIGHTPIRARGTFCGSIANADPASEWCLVATTLNAKMCARDVGGSRTIRSADFFSGIMTTALSTDEFLAEVHLPILPDDMRFGFYEVSRRIGDFAMAMSLVLWRLQDGKIVESRVGVGGVEPYPRRIAEAEARLEGQRPSKDVFTAAAAAAVEGLGEVLEDSRISSEYRRDLVRSVVLRALERSIT